MAHNGTAYASFSLAGGPEGAAAPAAEKVRRHPKYYLNGGDVHFLVRPAPSLRSALRA